MDESQTGKPQRDQITFVVSKQHKDELTVYSKSIGVSVSDVVRMAVIEFLSRHQPSLNNFERTTIND